jgi:site-specific recombinase XerD
VAVELLTVAGEDGRWRVVGQAAAADLELVNDYLGYVADRGYSPQTVRAYAYDLLHFARWLGSEGVLLALVDTDTLLRYLAANRQARLRGQRDNVISLRSGRAVGYAPTTINRRLAAISGLFSFRSMRDPAASNPVPKGPAARRSAKGERTGLLGHLHRPKPRSMLRVREPRRLPRGLDRDEISALLASFRAERDRAMAGLMLFSGLRSAEVLGLGVNDVDIGRGWVRVIGKGDKERRVPLDPDVAALVQSYLLAERPETTSTPHPGGTAPGVPLPPRTVGRRRRPPARSAPQLRDRPGRGWCGSRRAAGADGSRARRLLRRIHSPCPRPPALGV